MLAKRLQAAGDVDRDGLDGDSHQIGYFGITQLPLPAKDKGGLAPVGETRDYPLDRVGELAGFQLPRDVHREWLIRSAVLTQEPLHPALLHGLTAEVTDGVISEHGVQIRLDAVPDLQRVPILPELGKDIVHQLLGDVARADMAVCKVAKLRVVGAEEALERDAITALDVGDPGPIAGSGWSGS